MNTVEYVLKTATVTKNSNKIKSMFQESTVEQKEQSWWFYQN